MCDIYQYITLTTAYELYFMNTPIFEHIPEKQVDYM